jgi:deoxyadenosine/deoxycytidine kinase
MFQVDKELNFLVIEGNIGAGKTSLSKMISEDLQAKLVLENFADNPFLPKFYEDPEKYSFQLETSFLIDRYEQLKNELHTPDMFKKFVVADYYFPKSLIFAKNTLQSDEFNLYRKIFEAIYKNIPKPDLYVYLNLPIPRLLSNIKKRGRSYEQNIRAEYLEKIQEAYFEYIKSQKDISFLILNTENIDFVNNKKDYQKILDKIFNKKYKKGITNLIL